MKYVVDPALCCGHGQCYATAPEVYVAAEDGFNDEAGNTVDVPTDQEEAAREGAMACPESAILVLE